jgi:hypothetical protein
MEDMVSEFYVCMIRTVGDETMTRYSRPSSDSVVYHNMSKTDKPPRDIELVDESSMVRFREPKRFSTCLASQNTIY